MWSIKFYKSLEEIINGLYAVFAVDPEAQVFKENKVAGARAREDSLALEKELKKLGTYRWMLQSNCWPNN